MWEFWAYVDIIIDGQPGNRHKPQEAKLPQEKVSLLSFRRIVKKSMRNQGNNQPEIQHTTDKPISDKKARREAKKQEIKMQKKLNKQHKKEQHMDVESEGSD
jgi:hypothetical protein